MLAVHRGFVKVNTNNLQEDPELNQMGLNTQAFYGCAIPPITLGLSSQSVDFCPVNSINMFNPVSQSINFCPVKGINMFNP